MRVVARCPASCGELIQGLVGGQEMLISYPVNLYSTVELTVKKKPLPSGNALSSGHYPSMLYPKIYAALKYFLAMIGEKNCVLEQIDIKVASQIPVGKGMASSTADIAAAVAALAGIIGYPLTEEELAKIALSVEPTDSTIFKELTLFDHIHGWHIEKLGAVPRFNVLVCESPGTVDTLSFRQDKTYANKLRPRDKALANVKKGLQTNDLRQIGEAATESAFLNQELLPKPHLEALVELSHRHKALGVNVAHSGTVCGIIYDGQTDLELLQMEIASDLGAYFVKIYSLATIDGGPEIVDLSYHPPMRPPHTL